MTETQAAIQPYAPGVYAIREHAEVTRLRAMVDELAEIAGDPGSQGVLVDAHRIDLLRQIEEIKGAAAAAQARVTLEFEASQLAQQDAHGVSPNMRGRGIADQVALARGCPGSQGARHLGSPRQWPRCPTQWRC
jgi:hypothetical protein